MKKEMDTIANNANDFSSETLKRFGSRIEFRMLAVVSITLCNFFVRLQKCKFSSSLLL